MKNLGNIVKGWFTSIVGAVTMILTLVLIWTKAIDFIWEGIAGLSIGVIIMMMPETIEKLITQGLRSWGKQGGGYPSPYSPEDDPNVPPSTEKNND